eukprot:4439648-Pleurochrysis_carterae.AAC.3
MLATSLCRAERAGARSCAHHADLYARTFCIATKAVAVASAKSSAAVSDRAESWRAPPFKVRRRHAEPADSNDAETKLARGEDF